MGGPTGEMKNKILVAMYQGLINSYRVSVSQMAADFNRKINTISGHLSGLCEEKLVVERLRGQWELTEAGKKRAMDLLGTQEGIRFYGNIAAGPAIRYFEDTNEYINRTDLDPNIHFAMRVKGTSMTSYKIEDGDLIIFRRVTSLSEIKNGQIVAAYVPEGTDMHSDNWIEQLDQIIESFDGYQEPALDHITIKKIDTKMITYLQDGVEQEHRITKLRGTNGVMFPKAISVAGVAVKLDRDFQVNEISFDAEENLTNNSDSDAKTRTYIAILLIVAYIILIMLLPTSPGVGEALTILGPVVGYMVRYFFDGKTTGPQIHWQFMEDTNFVY